MKKRILSHLLVCIITCILVVPFSIVKGATNVTAYSSGQFTHGYWSTYYGVNSNGYVVLQEFGLIQNVQQFESVLVTKIDLDNYYDGILDITCYGNMTNNLWEFYVEGEGAYIIGSDNTHIQINLVHCQQFYLVGLCGNDNDTFLRPKTIDSTGIYSSIYNNVNISYNTISNLRLSWSHTSAGPNNTVILNNYNKNYYFQSLSLSSLVRVDSKFKVDNDINGNYIMCKYAFILQGSNVSPDTYNNFDGLRFQYRNFEGTLTNITIFDGDDFGYYKYVEFNTTRNAYILTLYIPLAAITPTNDPLYTYDFNFYNFELNNITSVGFMYGGVVESLPEQNVNDNTSSDINDVTDDLTNISNDIEDFESDIRTDFYNNMNNIDLDDYNIFSQLQNTSYFFKTYIDDFFLHLGDFKALFIVPIIVTILMLIIGWVI